MRFRGWMLVLIAFLGTASFNAGPLGSISGSEVASLEDSHDAAFDVEIERSALDSPAIHSDGYCSHTAREVQIPKAAVLDEFIRPPQNA